MECFIGADFMKKLLLILITCDVYGKLWTV